MKSFQEMAAEVRAVNVAAGWYEDSRTFGEDIALLHSEVSEALEAYRDWGTADATVDLHAEGKRHKTATYSGPCPSDQCPPTKPEGVGSEFADVLIRLLDSCDRAGINLEAEYERKLAYNKTRGYKHGGRVL